MEWLTRSQLFTEIRLIYSFNLNLGLCFHSFANMIYSYSLYRRPYIVYNMYIYVERIHILEENFGKTKIIPVKLFLQSSFTVI